MIKRLFFAAIVLLIFALPALAKHVDVETAKAVARTFWSQNLGKQTRATFSDVTSQTEFTNFYIINADGGFVIVSANDIAHPILGYSDSGNFDPQNIPVNMHGWLLGYEDEIDWGISNGATASTEIEAEWEKLSNGQGLAPKRSRSVTALIQTKWGQDMPYNNFCPYDNNEQTNALTGCIATAMAQIMKYWDYPTNGIGSHSYTHDTYGTLSADFENTTYDWGNMLNEYTSAWATQQQKDAVATLMYHCGVAVEMDYGVGASGAPSISLGGYHTYCAENALKDFFGYSTTIQGLYKESYSDNDWKNILKAELDAGRPILYSGYDPEAGGHAFVCDGYDANEYFHINWGWGGNANGFYMLEAMDLGSLDYSYDQDAVIGIQPNTSYFDSLVVTPANLYFGSEGGILSFQVNSSNNVSENWTAVSSAEWLTLSATSGEGGGAITNVTATADANTSYADKTATITVTHGSIRKVINVLIGGAFYLNTTVNDQTLGYLPNYNGWYDKRYFNWNDDHYYLYVTPLTTNTEATAIPDDDLFNNYHILHVHPYPNARFLGWNANVDVKYAFNTIKELFEVTVNNPIDTVNIEAMFAPVHSGDTLHYCNNTNWNTNGIQERCRFTDTTTYYRWGVKFDPSALNGVTQIPQIEALLVPYADQSHSIPCVYTIQLWQGGDDSPQTLLHTHTHTEDGNGNSVWRLIRFSSPVTIDNTKPLWVVISTTVPILNVGWTPLYTRDYCGNPNSNYIWTSQTGWTHYKKNSRLTQNGIFQFDPEVNNSSEIQNSWAIRVYTAVPTGIHVDTEVAGWNGTEIGNDHVIGGGAYSIGDNVTLTAVPDSGHDFVHWFWRNTDNPDSEWQQVFDNPVTFTVNSNVTYKAYFADTALLNIREVTTMVTNWNASTEIGDDHVIGGGTYAVGSSVTLTAVPDNGHSFKYWLWKNNDIPDSEWQRVYDNPVTFTIDYNVTYKAYFGDNAFINIRSNYSPLGIVYGSWPSSHSDYLAVGSTATITAEPINNGIFIRWEWYYQSNPSVVYQTTENPHTFTAESDAYYTAYFEEAEHTVVTVNVNDITMGSASGGGGFNPGSIAFLTAMPYEGCIFTHWEWYYDSNPATVYQTTDNPVTFTVERSVTYTAFFELETSVTSCHVSVLSNNNAWGTVYVNGNSSGDFMTGETAVLTATPSNGYQFAYWILEEEGMTYPQYNPLYFTIYQGMEGNYSFTGYFEPLSGIDETDTDNIRIYSLDGCIIVKDAEGETVTIYDMTGRIVQDCGLSNGVYMVKVGNRPIRKVVVAD
ncbi:MAG: C10 family peptidase [Bacteroidales bacterium]|nr:C10 family peptidase [Bacteroidales bacterium]